MCHGIRTALDTLYIREPYTVAHGRESIYHGTALIISLALSFGGVRTHGHVSFLISAAISVSNDRPYKLERLLSRVRETPPPREEEGRREQETAAALPPLLHFASLSRCIRCPPISFELNSRATRFFKRRQERDRDRQMTSWSEGIKGGGGERLSF